MKGQFKQLALEENMQFQSERRSWSLQKQVDYLCRVREADLKARRAHRGRGLVLTVDVDAALSGRYALRFKPNLPADLAENSRVTVEVVVCGGRQILGRAYVG